jgi:hypothetical protein
MGKLSTSSKQIEPPKNNSLARCDTLAAYTVEHNKIVIDYLEKYAAIAGRAITPQVYVIYCEALEAVSMRQLKKGLKRYLEEGTRWPWPGDLAQFCEDEI